jgi:hypothetical protein
MKRTVVLVGLLVAVAVGVVVPAIPAVATWVGTHCSDYSHSMSIYRRKDARAYVDIALKEGYEWGGGCWNNNNVDDTPGQPDSSGEGPDCSGLVFKTWGLKSAFGAAGVEYWDPLMNIHGPYTSYTFYGVGTTSNLPFFRVSKSAALSMDAFSRDSHVGLMYSAAPTSQGTYWFAEAKGDAYGTNLFDESWMADSNYVAVRRKGWTPECYPTCMRAAGARVVAVRS